MLTEVASSDLARHRRNEEMKNNGVVEQSAFGGEDVEGVGVEDLQKGNQLRAHPQPFTPVTRSLRTFHVSESNRHAVPSGCVRI